MVIDDSDVTRQLIAEALIDEHDIEVVGLAPSGRIALDKIDYLHPDLVTLDLHAPDGDGDSTLESIRRGHPKIALILFASQADRESAATRDALGTAAHVFITKPTGIRSSDAAVRILRAELVPRIRDLCGRSPRSSLDASDTVEVARGSRRAIAPLTLSGGRIDAVVMAASTGGPQALGQVIPALSPDLPVPVLIVQHMPEDFTRLMADRLDAAGPLKVQEGVSGALVRPGEVWLAPGGYHMVLRRRGALVELQITDDPPVNSCRPAADLLFSSAADVYGPRVLGVVLTVMGSDGLRGSESLVEAGGLVVAQDESSSAVWGMPGEVARAGLAHAVVPIERMAAEITRRASTGRSLPRTGEPA